MSGGMNNNAWLSGRNAINSWASVLASYFNAFINQRFRVVAYMLTIKSKCLENQF
jgi:hypothetical protein